MASTNHNAFGLRGHVFIARSGRAWSAAANDLNARKVGDVLRVGSYEGTSWASLGFEIPRRLEDAPFEVVKQVWGTDADERVNGGAGCWTCPTQPSTSTRAPKCRGACLIQSNKIGTINGIDRDVQPHLSTPDHDP